MKKTKQLDWQQEIEEELKQLKAEKDDKKFSKTWLRRRYLEAKLEGTNLAEERFKKERENWNEVEEYYKEQISKGEKRKTTETKDGEVYVHPQVAGVPDASRLDEEQ